jgi:hypothetical protein
MPVMENVQGSSATFELLTFQICQQHTLTCWKWLQEFYSFINAALHFRALEYIIDPFNQIDWAHFVALG